MVICPVLAGPGFPNTRKLAVETPHMLHHPARLAALLVLLSGAQLAWTQTPPAPAKERGPTTIDADRIEGVSDLEVTARGRAAQRLLGLMSAFIAENKANEKMKEFVEPLEKALGRVQDAALFLMQNAMKNPDEAGAAATDLLRLMALTAMTYMWNRIAIAAHKGLAAGNDNAFYEAKLHTARFYIARVLPQSTALNHQRVWGLPAHKIGAILEM